MMVIEAHNISKKYILSHHAHGLNNPLTHSPLSTEKTEDFWALKDVSFSINKGDRVGIIGRNGSGKSTLLKILSQITHPSSGHITIRGRIASLLEVGTGFHPELTGRENIFLNGAILGMRRKEIINKFDAIVDFAEIEKFIDTPVKNYSSGMYVRLAFSVASHLEHDILIADEILSVGDIDFQKKCYSKMMEIGNLGTTILYVSHSLSSIKNLCDTAILLENGYLVSHTDADTVIENYLSEMKGEIIYPLKDRNDRTGNQLIKFKSISFIDSAGNEIATAQMGQAIRVMINFDIKNDFFLDTAIFVVSFINQLGEKILCLYDQVSRQNMIIHPSTKTVEIIINHLSLMPGKYTINLYSKINGDVADWILNTSILRIVPDKLDTKYGLIPPSAQGLCHITHQVKIDL